ncbi:UDP-2,4-diacetamido-2,4,6-trideoxy-beta-L-altropyranose hydrolase [Flavobacterium sp. N1736]|uniref:UDP-2,4-diacetamido-2,4, 6-trideoxy-beta-L-altropyranose hydrolase n=1 Tax=Flavobacterium sp. N1736 TaxID=2986823 RepID=UPI0022254233|nr:UDP-2,4-diacetamido-2,4,6-trideoxy-beta-L-altropyranose hydrolase [Flavobacterium sp. N1736]
MSSTKNRVLFRADGNSKIGLGHVIRCIALAQMLKNEFECFFVIYRPAKEVILILQKFGKIISLSESNELVEFEKSLNKNDIVVIDGYTFDEEYIGAIKKQIKKIVQIDDFAHGYFSSDLVINHANSNLIYRYNVSPNTKVLCGFEYLILREQFLKIATKGSREISKVDTAFICMGGADPTNITLKVIQSCIQADFIKKVIVVTGAAYIQDNQLKIFISKNSQINIVHHTNINAERMIDLIEAAEICICPASSISLEVCCVKSGLLTGITADNQKLIHEQLIEGNYAETVGDFNSVSIGDIVLKLNKINNLSYINSLIKNQSIFADGKSGERILNEFKKLEKC